MNVEIGIEAAQFPEQEYINGIFVAVCYVLCYAPGATVCDVALCAKLCVGCVGGPSPNLCSIPLCLPAQNLFESRQEGEREKDM
jgi:hypothetical protein